MSITHVFRKIYRRTRQINKNTYRLMWTVFDFSIPGCFVVERTSSNSKLIVELEPFQVRLIHTSVQSQFPLLLDFGTKMSKKKGAIYKITTVLLI